MRRELYFTMLCALLCALVLGSCMSDDPVVGLTDDPAANGQPCTMDEECPKGWVCNLKTRYCEDPAAPKEADAPLGEGGADADIPVSGCGNMTIDAPEVCDGGQKDCIVIDPAQFEGGYAACKKDCSGWDTAGCQIKTQPDTATPDTAGPDVDTYVPPAYPVVVSSEPADDGLDVDKNTSIKIVFSMAMKVDTLRVNSNIILSEKETSTDIDMDDKKASYNPANFTLTIPLAAPLKEATRYQIRMLNSITGENGATLNNGNMQAPKPEIILFETIAPPLISTTIPSDNAANIDTSLTEFKVFFTETVDPAQLTAILDNTTELARKEEGQGAAYTYTLPAAALVSGKTYQVLIVGAKDLKGNVMPDTTVSFTTKYTEAPKIVTRVPDAGAIDVPLMDKASITFSQKMDPATISASKITLKRVVGQTRVDVTPAPVVTLDKAGEVAVITAEYKPGNTYEITVAAGAAGVKNASAIALADDDGTADGKLLWQFTLKESEILLATEFESNDGLFLIKDEGEDPGWLIDTTDKRAEITLDGMGYYQNNVDSWLYTATAVDLTSVTGSAYLEFSLMISSYYASSSDTNNDGVEILIWDADSETMQNAKPLAKAAVSGSNLDNWNTFQGHEGFCGYANAQTYYTYKVDLTARLGTKVGIAFRFICDDSWDKKDGAWIDWIHVLK